MVGRPRKVVSTGEVPEYDFSRLDVTLLEEILQLSGFPRCEGFNLRDHFTTLEKYVNDNSIKKQNWINLFKPHQQLAGGVEKYRELYLTLPNRKLPYNFLVTWNSWVTRRFLKLENNNFQFAKLKDINVPDENRFLLCTLAFLVKSYNNSCLGPGSVNTKEREQILGVAVSKAYQEAQRHMPDVWINRLLNVSDQRKNELDLEDEDGERKYHPGGIHNDQDEIATDLGEEDVTESSEISTNDNSSLYSEKITQKQNQIMRWERDAKAYCKKLKDLNKMIKKAKEGLEILKYKKEQCLFRERLYKGIPQKELESISKVKNIAKVCKDSKRITRKVEEKFQITGTNPLDFFIFITEHIDLDAAEIRKQYLQYKSYDAPGCSSTFKKTASGVIIANETTPAKPVPATGNAPSIPRKKSVPGGPEPKKRRTTPAVVQVEQLFNREDEGGADKGELIVNSVSEDECQLPKKSTPPSIMPYVNHLMALEKDLALNEAQEKLAVQPPKTQTIYSEMKNTDDPIDDNDDVDTVQDGDTDNDLSVGDSQAEFSADDDELEEDDVRKRDGMMGHFAVQFGPPKKDGAPQTSAAEEQNRSVLSDSE